eukprot:scaffold95043_cov36-Phaeocystis_antarctica.AAC.2
MGAVDLGERPLLLVLGVLAGPEGADVGGESRLLLGRVLVVLERGVGLGRVVVHLVGVVCEQSLPGCGAVVAAQALCGRCGSLGTQVV